MKHCAAALVVGLGLWWTAAAMANHAVTDDLGNHVALTAPAERIVSLAPHVTELLFAAGAGDRVIAVDRYSDYPEQAREIPRIGDAIALDIERIVALQPDLVVGWHSGNGAKALANLRDLGLTVFASEPRALADVPRSIEAFGQLAGTQQAAEAAAESFRSRRRALAVRYAHRSTVSTFFQIGHEPLMTINGEHMISQVIRLCGGANVFADLRPLAGIIDVEAVLHAAPEAIIVSQDVSSPSWLEDWERWRQLPASRYDNLFTIPASLMHRQGPRLLDGAELLCEALDTARKRIP